MARINRAIWARPRAHDRRCARSRRAYACGVELVRSRFRSPSGARGYRVAHASAARLLVRPIRPHHGRRRNACSPAAIASCSYGTPTGAANGICRAARSPATSRRSPPRRREMHEELGDHDRRLGLSSATLKARSPPSPRTGCTASTPRLRRRRARRRSRRDRRDRLVRAERTAVRHRAHDALRDHRHCSTAEPAAVEARATARRLLPLDRAGRLADVMSSTTRLTSRISLIMREAICSSRS